MTDTNDVDGSGCGGCGSDRRSKQSQNSTAHADSTHAYRYWSDGLIWQRPDVLHTLKSNRICFLLTPQLFWPLRLNISSRLQSIIINWSFACDRLQSRFLYGKVVVGIGYENVIHLSTVPIFISAFFDFIFLNFNRKLMQFILLFTEINITL